PRRLASVAAAAVGGALAHAVLARVTAALALDGRAWDLAADALTVHRAPEGHLDRVAVRPPVWVVAGDPAAPAMPSPASPSPAAPRSAGVASAGVASAGVAPAGVAPDGVAPDGVAPDGVAPDAPVRVFPDEAALLDAV